MLMVTVIHLGNEGGGRGEGALSWVEADGLEVVLGAEQFGLTM